MNKLIEKGAIALAAVGALNWGLTEFLNFDALSLLSSFPPIVKTIAIGAIAASGALVGYMLVQKKI